MLMYKLLLFLYSLFQLFLSLMLSHHLLCHLRLLLFLDQIYLLLLSSYHQLHLLLASRYFLLLLLFFSLSLYLNHYLLHYILRNKVLFFLYQHFHLFLSLMLNRHLLCHLRLLLLLDQIYLLRLLLPYH